MSTRSYIGLLNKDGSVRTIYHHWDGDVSCVGYMLSTHYKTEDKINKLLDLGDMSTMGSEPIGIWGEGPKEYCQTYRARGEKNIDAKTYKSVSDFLGHCCEEYTYLFKDGEWLFRYWNDEELKSVEEELKKISCK